MRVRLFIILTLSFSAFAYEREIDVSRYLNVIRAEEQPAKPTSVEEALTLRKKYPPQKEVIIHSNEDASELCDTFFKGIIFWQSCEQDISNKVIPKKVMDLAKMISRTPNYRVIQPLLLTASSGYIDGDAFNSLSAFVNVTNLDLLAALMVNTMFDSELVPMCEGRENPVDEIFNMESTSPRPNQKNIFDCIFLIRNQQVTLQNKVKVMGCKAMMDIVSRTSCLESALGN